MVRTTASARLLRGQPVERAEQRLAPREIEPRTRLVEQQQPRTPDQCARDQGALALSLRAVAEPALADRAEPERPDQVVGSIEVEPRQALLEVA